MNEQIHEIKANFFNNSSWYITLHTIFGMLSTCTTKGKHSTEYIGFSKCKNFVGNLAIQFFALPIQDILFSTSESYAAISRVTLHFL